MSKIRICFILVIFCSSGYSVILPGGCDKPTNNVPVLLAAPDTFQALLGGHKINGWTMFSADAVLMQGLWCQVNPSVNFNMSNNAANWYATTGFNTLDAVLTSRPATFPYELFQCIDQTGVTLVGDFDGFQGIVKCNTTAPMLTTSREFYFSVFTSEVFNNYSGPSVQPTMNLNVMSRRDEDLLNITLSFNVSFGLPSRVICIDQQQRGKDQAFVLFNASEASFLSREVLQTHYFNSSVVDITRVTITLNNVEKKYQSYACNATVEGYRSTLNLSIFSLVEMGIARSNISIFVASAPANVTVTPVVHSNSVIVEWNAPSKPPSHYEVFYQSQNDSQPISGGVTRTVMTTLTGLQRGELYTFYVVGFEETGNVFPSKRSNAVTMLLVDPSSTVTNSETIVQSTIQSTMTPLATPTDITYNGRTTIEEPIGLIAMMLVGWTLFPITLILLIITLITWFCQSHHRKKNSTTPLPSAPVPIEQDEELYDSIDQLTNDQHNTEEMTNCEVNITDKYAQNNTPIADVQNNRTNTDESKAVEYNNTRSDIGTVDNDINMTSYTAIPHHDEEIIMTECDAYESANTNSRNHQTHDEEDITMTECSAYGTNQRPQSEYYDDIVNSKPSDQQHDTVDYDDYV